MNRRFRGACTAAAERAAGIASALVLAACTAGAVKGPPLQTIHAPYPRSLLIPGVHWDFSAITNQRKAHGSDLWPCAWAADGDLYCAWGDGGGFDGDDDLVGRASLGFASITGTPDSLDPTAFRGTNIWGSPPFARFAATFGGKVGSIAAVDGVLYALGGFWTADDSADPVHAGGRGPVSSVAWSTDSAKSWTLAGWSSPEPLGTFLDTGQDSLARPVEYLFIYYLRSSDTHHVFLKRIRPERLKADPAKQSVEYFSGTRPLTRDARWSAREADARPIFEDPNHVEGPSVVYDRPLDRYLFTAGHYVSANDDDSSAGQVGIFEARHPWGPWRTVAYYEDWGRLSAETRGDFLSLRLPSKWLSGDGRTFWAVFSGRNSFDSFNVVRGVLQVR